jgi:hypothetical protein
MEPNRWHRSNPFFIRPRNNPLISVPHSSDLSATAMSRWPWRSNLYSLRKIRQSQVRHMLGKLECGKRRQCHSAWRNRSGSVCADGRYAAYGRAESFFGANSVITRNDKGDIEGVKYNRVGVVLLNVVNEQQQQIESQQKKIERQQKHLEHQSQTIEDNKKNLRP